MLARVGACGGALVSPISYGADMSLTSPFFGTVCAHTEPWFAVATSTTTRI